MQAFTVVGGLVVAAIAQWFNRYPNVPAPIVKLGLAAVGLAMYAVVQQPAAWSGQPFLDWLDTAWLWALALPGAASLIGSAPGMGTNSKGGNQ